MGTTLQSNPQAMKVLYMDKPATKMKTINWTKVPPTSLESKCKLTCAFLIQFTDKEKIYLWVER